MLVTGLVCVIVIAEIVYRFYLIYIFSASPVVFFLRFHRFTDSDLPWFLQKFLICCPFLWQKYGV